MMSKTKGSQAPKSKKSFVSNCLLLLNCLLIMTPVDAYCSTLVDKIAQVSASSLVLNYQTTLSNAPSQSATVQTPQPTNAYECTQVAIEDIDPTLLTKEERIALLDGSLKDSIDQYSTCVSTVQQNMSASAGGSGGGSDPRGAARHPDGDAGDLFDVGLQLALHVSDDQAVAVAHAVGDGW